MLDAFLKLVEYLIRLVQGRQQDRAALFRDVVEPLFVQLQPVVDDLFSIFMDARVALRTRNADWAAVGAKIRARRNSLLAARRLTKELALAVESHTKDKRVADFAFKVLEVLGSTVVHRQQRYPSDPQRLVELFDYLEAGERDRSQLIEYVDEMLRHLENSWTSLAQSYASLRLYCLTPPRFARSQQPGREPPYATRPRSTNG